MDRLDWFNDSSRRARGVPVGSMGLLTHRFAPMRPPDGRQFRGGGPPTGGFHPALSAKHAGLPRITPWNPPSWRRHREAPARVPGRSSTPTRSALGPWRQSDCGLRMPQATRNARPGAGEKSTLTMRRAGRMATGTEAQSCRMTRFPNASRLRRTAEVQDFGAASPPAGKNTGSHRPRHQARR